MRETNEQHSLISRRKFLELCSAGAALTLAPSLCSLSQAIRGTTPASTPEATQLAVSGWVKSKFNPVLGGSLGTCYDVCVLQEGNQYRMWFSWRPQKSIALVESGDGIHWSSPEISLAPDASTGWEDEIDRPIVLKLADGYAMWYSAQSKTYSRIGYATSPDGRKWTRVSKDPVLSPDVAWEGNGVMCPDVIYDPSQATFRMWYSGGNFGEPIAIGYATSKDGIHWDKLSSNPIFSPFPGHFWEQDRVTACQVLQHGEWHLMFYIGFSDANHAQIGLARSKDGISDWERHPANPIIRPDVGKWDGDSVYKPFAIFDKDHWYLWYNGRLGGSEQIGLAIHAGEDLGF